MTHPSDLNDALSLFPPRETTDAPIPPGDGHNPSACDDGGLAALIADRALLADLATLPLTHVGNAEALYRIAGERFRHVRTRPDGRGHWLAWNGHLWEVDRRGAIERATVLMARVRQAAAALVEGDDARKEAWGWARGSEKYYNLQATLEVARTVIAPWATLPEDYDRDPWLLGCSNGVLDLHGGALRPGRPEDNITLSTGLPYEPAAACPRWEQFLVEVFDGDEALVRYVHKAAGYSLTGDIREPALFLCHGGGRNGKSTLLNILRAMLGGYACNTPFSTFRKEDHGGIPNDVAALAGKRLVTASEAPESSLNEDRVKVMTGTDAITARFLHGEYFSFQPTGHVWLAMNHKPRIVGTDDGIWSRVKLIPFQVSFLGREDKALLGALMAELPGILAWAVRGCLLWQAEGLGEAEAVRVATLAYREESDNVGRFVADCCTLQPGARVTAAALRAAYEAWAAESGEHTLARGPRWGERLAQMGCTQERVFSGGRQTRGWRGIGLLPSVSLDGTDAADGTARLSHKAQDLSVKTGVATSSPSVPSSDTLTPSQRHYLDLAERDVEKNDKNL